MHISVTAALIQTNFSHIEASLRVQSAHYILSLEGGDGLLKFITLSSQCQSASSALGQVMTG